jgi:RNA polymerase sigma-70 factor, ECF subfamily
MDVVPAPPLAARHHLVAGRSQLTMARPASATASWSDADLHQALLVGSPDAVEELVARFGPRTYRLALRITGKPEDAQEVAQDVMWTVARKIDMFKGESALGSWIYRITANAAYQKLRGRRDREEVSWETLLSFDGDGHFMEPVRDWSAAIEDPALQAEARDRLRQAIDSLPPDYRTAFVLHDMEGLPNPEIAELLGISLPAVKSRVHRSRLFLRQRLADYFG